jgi:hypothetical protein
MNGKSPTNGGKQQHLDHGQGGWLESVAHGHKQLIRPEMVWRTGQKLAENEVSGNHA